MSPKSIWMVDWRVAIDGRDVSNNMRPYLLAIEVVDKAGRASDECHLTFDDSDGQLLLPETGASVEVTLQGSKVFTGTVDSTQWTLSRGSGSVLIVDAMGIDMRSRVKERVQWHLDEATLGEALKKGASKAGVEIVIDPDFAGIRREYWCCDQLHFMEWAQVLADDLGATFKVRNGKAVFAKRGGGRSVSGALLPTITGRVGTNVFAVSITPSRGRPQFNRSRVRFFDRKSATFESREVEIEGTSKDVDVVDAPAKLASDGDDADRRAFGRKVRSEREAGVGTVEIDLDPQAQAEGTFVLIGARPGIDGTYRITGVTHRTDRQSGSRTTLDLAQPSGDAGKDGRIPVPTPQPAASPRA